MKIKTQLYLSSIIISVLIGTLFAILFYTNSKIETASKTHELAHEVEKAVSELNILTYEYLIYHEKRMIEQWHTRYSSLAPALAAAAAAEEEEELILALNQNYLALDDLFSQITTIYAERQKLSLEEAAQEKIDISIALEQRLVTQFLLKSQKLVSDSSKLAEGSWSAMAAVRSQAAKLRIFFYFILGLTSLITTLVVIKTITKSLTKLHKGADIIGAGNLEHKIDIKTKDEIGQVTAAFNEMAVKLKELVTIKIKEAQLERELKQQKKIDKMKTEFVSLASHQLRTPLTVIKWYSEMLLRGNAGKLTLKQKKYLGELYQGNERMIDLVRNLLNVSRIEMGVLAVNPKPTDIRELIRRIIEDQTPFVQEKKHKVIFEMPKELPKISTDPELVRMIFQNLFGNAIEYTPAGGKITCTAEKKDNEIIIGIKDTGIGIPKKQQSQVFQKLFRGDNGVKEHPEGTGLELYITKAMVDALSGKIWFKSKEGKGTTFWVALPLKGPAARPGQKIINNHNHYGQTK